MRAFNVSDDNKSGITFFFEVRTCESVKCVDLPKNDFFYNKLLKCCNRQGVLFRICVV